MENNDNLPNPSIRAGCDIRSVFKVWLVSLFNGISTFVGFFNAKAILLEEQSWYYLTHSWVVNGVHTFPKDICLKVNEIARLEYELAYYDSVVHRFNHYTTRTPHPRYLLKNLFEDVFLLWCWAWIAEDYTVMMLKFVNSAINVCSNLSGCFEVVPLSLAPTII